MSGFDKNHYASWNTSKCPRIDDNSFANQYLVNKCFSYDYRIIKESTFVGSTINYKRDYRHISNDDFMDNESGEIVSIFRGIKFQNKVVKRIYSERNILPEKESNKIQVDGNGNGASNIINKFINKSNLDLDIIEKRSSTYQLNFLFYHFS